MCVCLEADNICMYNSVVNSLTAEIAHLYDLIKKALLKISRKTKMRQFTIEVCKRLEGLSVSMMVSCATDFSFENAPKLFPLSRKHKCCHDNQYTLDNPRRRKGCGHPEPVSQEEDV